MNSHEQRVSITTPAVTIVAAWISAETGVGPAIASGSHVQSGICADLPIAPMKSRIQTPVIADIPKIGASPLRGCPTPYRCLAARSITPVCESL